MKNVMIIIGGIILATTLSAANGLFCLHNSRMYRIYYRANDFRLYYRNRRRPTIKCLYIRTINGIYHKVNSKRDKVLYYEDNNQDIILDGIIYINKKYLTGPQLLLPIYIDGKRFGRAKYLTQEESTKYLK